MSRLGERELRHTCERVVKETLESRRTAERESCRSDEKVVKENGKVVKENEKIVKENEKLCHIAEKESCNTYARVVQETKKSCHLLRKSHATHLRKL